MSKHISKVNDINKLRQQFIYYYGLEEEQELYIKVDVNLDISIIRKIDQLLGYNYDYSDNLLQGWLDTYVNGEELKYFLYKKGDDNTFTYVNEIYEDDGLTKCTISISTILDFIEDNKIIEAPLRHKQVEIKQGTIVKATRNNGDNHPYIWQGVYFGYCNDKHLIDFNGTHCMVADEIEVVPTLSKKEAKQKVSELFANNGKNVSSQKIREIIDLIELDDCDKGENE